MVKGPGNCLEDAVQRGRLDGIQGKQELVKWVNLVGTTYGLTDEDADTFSILFGKLIKVGEAGPDPFGQRLKKLAQAQATLK